MPQLGQRIKKIWWGLTSVPAVSILVGQVAAVLVMRRLVEQAELAWLVLNLGDRLLILAAVGIAGFIVGVLGFKRRVGWLRVVIFIALGGVLGIRTGAQLWHWAEGHINQGKEGEVVVVGVIGTEPVYKATKAQYTVEVLALCPDWWLEVDWTGSKNDLETKIGKACFPVKGPITVNYFRYPGYKVGHIIVLQGELTKISNTPRGILDYRSFMLDKGIKWAIWRPVKIEELIETNSGQLSDYLALSYSVNRSRLVGLNYWFLRQLGDLKDRIWVKLREDLPSPQAELLMGMVVGTPIKLEEWEEIFRINGLSHILSISGYNVNLFVLGVVTVAKPLGKKTQLWLSMLMVILFISLSGFSPAAFRAGLMGIVTLLAMIFGTSSQAFIFLVWSLVLALFFRPDYLFDVGMHLSISATLGLLYLLPILRIFLRLILFRALVIFKPLEKLPVVYKPGSLRYLNRLFIPWLVKEARKKSWISYFGSILFGDMVSSQMMLKVKFKGWWEHLISFLEDYLLVTVTATIATLGIIVYNFGTFSLLNIPANFVALPVVEQVGIVGLFLLFLNLLALFLKIPIVGGLLSMGRFIIALPLNLLLTLFLKLNLGLYQWVDRPLEVKIGLKELWLYYLVLGLFCLIFYPYQNQVGVKR